MNKEHTLQLKDIAPYLPYGISFYYEGFNNEPIPTWQMNEHTNLHEVLYFQNKPLLRPLSDLTKEIEVNGERFVPIVELFKMIPSSNYVDYRGNFKYPQFQIDDEWNHCLSYENKQQDTLCFSFDSNTNSFMLMVNETVEFVSNQLSLFQKMREWHIDLERLIEKGLAIDLNTITNG